MKKYLRMITLFVLSLGVVMGAVAGGAQEEETPTIQKRQQTEVTVENIQNQVETVYDDANSSVVNITSTVITPNVFSRPVPQKGAGTGFVWDEGGYIVTNYHVIQNAKSVTVSMGDSEMIDAEIVGTDPFTDLAVLKVEAQTLPDPLPIGNSDDLDVGEFVVAIGNPFSFEQTLTFGVVSALGRVIRSPGGRFISEAIQTDTPINPGNSGGPLLDMDGNVIGVNSAIISPSGASAGVGFAISSNTVANVIPALIEEGHYPHPWLGFRSISLNPGLVKVLKQVDVTVPVEKGILIVSVLNGSPADKAGLRGGRRQLQIGNLRLPVGGDIIVGVNGTSVTTYKNLVVYLEEETKIGDTIEITFYRGDEKRTETVTVGERPQDL
jgi:S1-C subfamily serine protease